MAHPIICLRVGNAQEFLMRLEGVSLSSVPPVPPLQAPSSLSQSSSLTCSFFGVVKAFAPDLEPFFWTLPAGIGWPMESKKPITSPTTSGCSSNVLAICDRSLRNLISRART